MLLCKEYLTLVKKLSLVVFCCNFSTLQQKPQDYICIVAAKIWYVRFLLGHPVYNCNLVKHYCIIVTVYGARQISTGLIEDISKLELHHKDQQIVTFPTEESKGNWLARFMWKMVIKI